MRDRALLAVGLDAGSEKCRCVVLALTDSDLHFLGCGEAHSSAWRRGRITDIGSLSRDMETAIARAERMARVPVDAVTLGIGGNSVRGGVSRGAWDWGWHKEIEQDTVNRVMAKALRVRLEEDEMVLHAFPQSFRADGRDGFRTPVGATSTRLEADVYLITCSTQEHQALIGAANSAHVVVEETVYEPVAAAYASILPDDRKNGVALLDIGRDSSELVMYQGESLMLARSLRLAGGHFTGDIAYGLSVHYDGAELLKREYGCANLSQTAANSVIEVPSPDPAARREEPRRKLNAILESRAEELFESVAEALDFPNLRGALHNGIVLAGGGALLPGMWDMAEKVLGVPALTGLPSGITGWPDEINNAAWTTAAGLAMYSARLKLREEKERNNSGLLARLLRW